MKTPAVPQESTWLKVHEAFKKSVPTEDFSRDYFSVVEAGVDASRHAADHLVCPMPKPGDFKTPSENGARYGEWSDVQEQAFPHAALGAKVGYIVAMAAFEQDRVESLQTLVGYQLKDETR